MSDPLLNLVIVLVVAAIWIVVVVAVLWRGRVRKRRVRDALRRIDAKAAELFDSIAHDPVNELHEANGEVMRSLDIEFGNKERPLWMCEAILRKADIMDGVTRGLVTMTDERLVFFGRDYGVEDVEIPDVAGVEPVGAPPARTIRINLADGSYWTVMAIPGEEGSTPFIRPSFLGPLIQAVQAEFEGAQRMPDPL